MRVTKVTRVSRLMRETMLTRVTRVTFFFKLEDAISTMYEQNNSILTG